MSALPANSDARNLRWPEMTSNLPSSVGRTSMGLIIPPAIMLSMVSCINSSSSLTLNGWFLNGFSCSKGIRTTCSATSHSGLGSALAFSSISCAFVSCDRGEARASWDIFSLFAVSLVEAAMSLIPANLHHLPKMTEAAALCAAAQVKRLFSFVSRYKIGCEEINSFASQSYIYFSDF